MTVQTEGGRSVSRLVKGFTLDDQRLAEGGERVSDFDKHVKRLEDKRKPPGNEDGSAEK